MTAPATDDTLWTRRTALVIGAAALLRLVFALALGLGVDETYTVATARAFQWSTFDHPPMAWWIAHAMELLSGSEAAGLMRLPFVALGALAGALMFALTRDLFGARAAFFATLAYCCAPIAGVTAGSFVTPDTPLMPALLAGALCLSRALFTDASRAWMWWLLAGLCGGLAMLSKYHGVFLFAGAGLFLLTSAAHRRHLFTPWPWAGALVALAVFSPVIFWNIANGWASFAFQGGRSAGAQWRPFAPLAVLAGQALFLLPWIWLALVFAGWRALRRGPQDARSWLLLCIAIGPIAVFTLVALRASTRVFPHWAAPGYLLLFPLLGLWLAQAWETRRAFVRAWSKGTAIFTAALALLVSLFAQIGWPPIASERLAALRDPLYETSEWSDVREALAQRGVLGRTDVFASGLRWFESAKIDHALRGALPVTCICDDARGYGVLAPQARFAGRDAIIVVQKADAPFVQQALGGKFTSLEALGPLTIRRAGGPSLEAELYLGRGFRP